MVWLKNSGGYIYHYAYSSEETFPQLFQEDFETFASESLENIEVMFTILCIMGKSMYEL